MTYSEQSARPLLTDSVGALIQRERITVRAMREQQELHRMEDIEGPLDPLSNRRLLNLVDEIKSAIFIWE